MNGSEITTSTLGYTALSFLIPFGVYRVNQWLHQKGDPTWMKEEKQAKSSEQQKTRSN